VEATAQSRVIQTFPERIGHFSLRHFLGALFHDSDGFIELRALPSRQRDFVPPGDFVRIERFISEHSFWFAEASSSFRFAGLPGVEKILIGVDRRYFFSSITQQAITAAGCGRQRPSPVVAW
jgi:hypothetical protein